MADFICDNCGKPANGCWKGKWVCVECSTHLARQAQEAVPAQYGSPRWEAEQKLKEMSTPFIQGGVLSDFRSHTCGECAWAAMFSTSKHPTHFICRANGWGGSAHYPLDCPACPAFVMREKGATK